ncbi:MAG: organomercurial lyase [Candidatus Promineifilaceae bacterium]
MSEKSAGPTAADIAGALRDETGELGLSRQQTRLFIQALRLLALGRPVTREQVAQIAAGLEMPSEEAQTTLDLMSERSGQGGAAQIVGLGGLSLNNWTHKLRLGGRAFSTWCAFDTLYLPPLLGQVGEVESPDPITKEPVQLTVTPAGLGRYSPAGAVISMVVPQVSGQGLQSAEQIWSTFCNYSHYFASPATARQWFSTQAVEPVILALEEGNQLASQWAERLGRAA